MREESRFQDSSKHKHQKKSEDIWVNKKAKNDVEGKEADREGAAQYRIVHFYLIHTKVTYTTD